MLDVRCACRRLLLKTITYPEKIELDCRNCHSRITFEYGKITKVLTRNDLKRLKNNK